MRRFLFFLVLIGLIAAGGAWWVRHRLLTPYRGFGEPEIFVDLPAGSGEETIATTLAEAGVVPDPWTFTFAVRWTKEGRRLEAGEYRFATPASPFDVVWRLAHGDVYKRPVTFPEGLTIAEMAAIFERSGLGTAAAFEDAAADGQLVANLDPDATSLEGYLFPDTYPLPRRIGAAGAVHAMAARFEQEFAAHIAADAKAAGLSPREVVTLASIVEKETAAPAERPIVAAVYRNRLRLGMALQCDPTVIFALMQNGRWNGNLTREDLQMDSPYNTYRYPGLPPGPIAAPGLPSLEAVVHPADVPYLYFVSRNDGTHVFATTLAEHNQNVERWQVRYFREKNAR